MSCGVGYVDDNELERLETEAEEDGLASGEALKVSGHHMVGAQSGAPAFPVADTAWALLGAKREDVIYYLDKRKAQGYTTVLVSTGTKANAYGDLPWKLRSTGKPDVTKPNTTLGSNFNNATEYDYWDHALWVLGQVRARNMNAVMAFYSGSIGISGDYNGAKSATFIETTALAYRYGHHIGATLKSMAPYVIFSVLDDRTPMPSHGDKRAYYRAVAEGLTDGVNGVDDFNGSANYATTFITAMARKGEGSSSDWFHSEPWLDVNSIQAYPAGGRSDVAADFGKSPIKPTWVMEGRYEKPGSEWGAWSQRYQAYIPTFAGGFSASYGDETVCIFNPGWKNRLSAEASIQVPYLRKLMKEWSDSELHSRQPDQALLVNPGTLENTTVGGNFQAATRSADGKVAMVYAMNGRSITVNMSKLASGSMNAFWFNPRTGKWSKNGTEYATREASAAFTSVKSGSGAADGTFDPPSSTAEGNDWVLFLELAGSNTGTKPSVKLKLTSGAAAGKYSVEAVTTGSGIQQVDFKVDGKLYRTEKVSRYCLFAGNTDCGLGSFGKGSHVITATVVSSGGTASATLSVNE